jgi:hypothetical protein
MAQGGLIGSGAKVAYATGSPHTWNKIEQLLDVTPPTVNSAVIDKTIHQANRFKRNMAGLQDVTAMKLKMLRDADASTSPNQNALFDYLASQTDLWWRVELPANGSLTLFEAYEFQGRVSSFMPAAPIADKQTLESDVIFDGDSFVRYNPMATVLP